MFTIRWGNHAALNCVLFPIRKAEWWALSRKEWDKFKLDSLELGNQVLRNLAWHRYHLLLRKSPSKR